MNSEFLTTNDAEAERAVMAATAITPQFPRLAATATGILAQVCADQTEAATRVEKAISSMVSRGALELEGTVVAVRFERLAYENRARIRRKHWKWGCWDRGWPPDVASLVCEGQEPWLPLAAFLPSMQEALRDLLENGIITPRMQQGEPWIAEGDYLACHDASCEGPFKPLADFSPGIVSILLEEHAESPTLVVRNGVLCVPWGLHNPLFGVWLLAARLGA